MNFRDRGTYWPIVVYSDLLNWRGDALTGTGKTYEWFTQTEKTFVAARAVFAGALECEAPETQQEIHETVAALMNGFATSLEEDRSSESISYSDQQFAELTLRFGPDCAHTLIEYVTASLDWQKNPGGVSRQQLEEYADNLPNVVDNILRSMEIEHEEPDPYRFLSLDEILKDMFRL